MAEQKLSSTHAVNDYFSSLLLDTQLSAGHEDGDEPALRFARVESGFEVSALWSGPLNVAQALCHDLILLSFAQKVPGVRLRQSLLNALITLKHSS